MTQHRVETTPFSTWAAPRVLDVAPGPLAARSPLLLDAGGRAPRQRAGAALVDRIAALGGGDLAAVTGALLGTAGHRPASPADGTTGGGPLGHDRRPPGRRTIGRAEREVAAAVAAVLRAGAITPAYQPIVHLDDGRLVAVEALARFDGSAGAAGAAGVEPQRWFCAAHDLRLGLELELLAARRAIGGLGALPPGTIVSINASPLTLQLPSFVELLVRHAHRVVLELTEHHRVLDYGALTRALHPLRAAGLRVAVDDAGAGFASLRHILQIRPDLIKLDRALICGIDRDPRRRELAAALVGFAAELGAVLIAEGVERAGERDAVRALGIELGQGYGIARPMAATRITERYPRAAARGRPRPSG